jgi:hypothetical protein
MQLEAQLVFNLILSIFKKTYLMKNKNTLLVCLCSYLLLSSCAGLERTFTKPQYNTAIIPKDFNPETGVLLVAEMPRAYSSEVRNVPITNKMKKMYRKEYNYNYEIVSVKEISDPQSKYNDMTKYRYVVLNSLTSMERGNTDGIIKNQKVTFINYRFYDRLEKKYYDVSPNQSTFIKYVLPAFIETINKAIKERK